MQVGKLIVITGPSGVGKGTLVLALLKEHPELYLSISVTTRQPRTGETEGKEYYFVTKEKFAEMVKNNQLLEWAEYAGNYYGTPKQKVEEQINQGKSVILEIELIGARKIRENFPNLLRLFILPPSLEELEKRLRGRGNDSETAIQKRLEKAREEIDSSQEFDQEIVNDDLKTSLKKIEAAIFS